MRTLQGGLHSAKEELFQIHREIANLEQRLERLRSVTAKAMADLSGTERDDRTPTLHEEELERVASKIVTKLAQEVKGWGSTRKGLTAQGRSWQTKAAKGPARVFKGFARGYEGIRPGFWGTLGHCEGPRQ